MAKASIFRSSSTLYRKTLSYNDFFPFKSANCTDLPLAEVFIFRRSALLLKNEFQFENAPPPPPPRQYF